jgi:uncharacterized protein (DUF2062 family)
MFTPLGGPGLGLSFFETYFATVTGGIVGSAVFYFFGGYFIHRAEQKRQRLQVESIEKGIELPIKRKFTKMNKFIVKIKMSLGIVGISLWAPFFLSIPVGSIVTAKFYGHDKKTYPLIVVGMFINAFATTGIAYLIYG